MYQYIYLEQFYRDNSSKLLAWDSPLRPSKSVPKNGAAGVAKFQDFYKKTGLRSFSEEDVLKILNAENVDDGDTIFHQNLRVMRELNFVSTTNNGDKKYIFTEQFISFIESNHTIECYIIEKLMSIASVDDLTMYFNFLICVMREAALYGQVIQYRDAAQKFTIDVDDEQKRKEHQQRIYKVYGFRGDEARNVPENYTPNISYFCHAVLKQLGILAKSDKRIDNMGTLELTPLGEMILKKIDENIFYGQRIPQNQIRTIHTNNSLQDSLQQIFYGAPGTGKSHEIKSETKGKSVIRTTFHPDSDYSTFVGAYKPIMGKGKVYGAQGPLVEKNGQPIEEPKISYEFVKQAFLKAYLGAWKKIADGINSYPKVSFVEGGANYDILSVDDTQLTQKKIDNMAKGKVGNVWKSLWNNGKFVIPYGTQSGQSVEQAIAKWIYDNYTKKENDFENGWRELIEHLYNNEKILASKSDSGKKYQLLYDNQDTVFFCAVSNNKKEIIKNCYDSESISDNFERGITKKLKSYGADSFDNAWEMLKKEVNAIDPQFLIIEEINRGNCAQIFGDLFQLLDRSANGYSEYPIEADTDMQAAIKHAFAEEDEYKLDSLDLDGVIDDYVSNYNQDSTLSEDVMEGRVLLLPPNLYIWATMNTSDQSLFPIDSAFKRRWEWVYMPIKDHQDKGYKIEIDDTTYDWWGFLEKINSVINTATNSEDKKLGYFFVKTDKKIDAKKFVGKVLFYLWNDVFKNYGFDNPIFNKEDKNKYVFSDFFQKDGSPETNNIKRFLKNLDETIDKENPFTEKKPEETSLSTGNNNPDLFANQE